MNALLRNSFRPLFATAVIISALLLEGCSVIAPNYLATLENVQKLQKAGSSKVQVGSLTTKDDDVDILFIRAGAFTPPNKSSFSTYLQSALKTELASARRLDEGSNVSIRGELQENTLNAAVGIGSAHIKARFIVIRPEGTAYDKAVSADHQWNSPYLASLGISAAQSNYVVAVQKLLNNLFSDPDFQAAIK